MCPESCHRLEAPGILSVDLYRCAPCASVAPSASQGGRGRTWKLMGIDASAVRVLFAGAIRDFWRPINFPKINYY